MYARKVYIAGTSTENGMNGYKIIGPANWPRKVMFDYFSRAATPSYSITVKVAAEELFAFAKQKNESFFLLTLYAFLRTVNAVPEMRQRVIEDGKIVEFEHVAAVTAVSARDDMFRQVWCDYQPDYASFKASAAEKLAAEKGGDPRPVAPETVNEDYFSVNCSPWFHFEGVGIPDYAPSVYVPVIVWGMMKDGEIPVGIRFNHCFLDGVHVARFFKQLQRFFRRPELLYSAD